MRGQHPVPGEVHSFPVSTLNAWFCIGIAECSRVHVLEQISSPVVDRLLLYRPMLKRAVIMFQAEFAERMVAKYARACVLSCGFPVDRW